MNSEILANLDKVGFRFFLCAFYRQGYLLGVKLGKVKLEIVCLQPLKVPRIMSTALG